VDRYGAAAVQALEMPPNDMRGPLVTVPVLGEPRGELINAANLALPFGLVVLSARMLLRALRVACDPRHLAREDATFLEVTS
jgi:hypothetical protein